MPLLSPIIEGRSTESQLFVFNLNLLLAKILTSTIQISILNNLILF
jgi:hypothetical protein